MSANQTDELLAYHMQRGDDYQKALRDAVEALKAIRFDLINCHQAAGRDACEHLKDAIKIVNAALR